MLFFVATPCNNDSEEKNKGECLESELYFRNLAHLVLLLNELTDQMLGFGIRLRLGIDF